MGKTNVIKIFLALTIVVCSACCFVGCKKNESLYKPTNILYDGARITWSKVDLAEYYTVSVNGGEEKRVNSSSFAFVNESESEFDVVVSAIIKNKPYSESKHFIPLKTVDSFNVSDDGIISWNEVPDATAYRLSINGEVLATDITDTQYQAKSGSNRIKVRAVVPNDDSYYSVWSIEKQIFINSEPTSIDYDGEKITWLGNATNYEISIDGQKNTVSGNEFAYNSNNADFSVSIKAVGDHVNTFDSKIANEEFHYLKPVEKIVVEDGVLTWLPVDGAQGYQLRINSVQQNKIVETTSFDGLPSGTSLAVEIKPCNNSGKYFSVWSEIKNIYILEAPTVRWNSDLELDGEANNNFIWDIVNGAVGYTVELEKDGNVTKTNYPIAQTAFAHAYSEVGTYKVRVKAVAEQGSDYYDSKYSTEIIVERLSAPKASTTNFIVSDAADLSKGFTVNYNAVSNATGYQLYKDGVLLDGKYSTVLSITDSNVAEDSVSSQQEYNYMIRSIGGVRAVAGKTYVTLPCLTKDALSFKITVLPMPTKLSMSGFNAGWSTVTGNNGYGVKCDGIVSTATATTYDLSTIKAGEHQVSVCTKGNGSTVLASNYTAAINIQRLIAPTNIEISDGTGEGHLGFDSVANAKSYQVYLDESNQALPENAYDNMYQYIRETGTVLHMVSVANYYNDQGTVYYMTSESSLTQQFIRLATPVFPEGAFSNSVELVWSAPSNINTTEYTPTYEVYESEVMQTGGVQNATKFNIQYLEGGRSYTFRVKAIGNDSKYLNSDKSKAITVYKLSTPMIYIKNGKYMWQSVPNASSYVLEIDGVRVNNDIHVSGSEYSYTPNYTTIGNHHVKLYAVGDGYNTINSNASTFTQVVEACLTPEISFNYSNENFVEGGSINVTITKQSENCSAYMYEIAGESIVSSQLSVTKIVESTGSYVIRVKALGGVFGSNNTYYIESQFVGGGSAYTINLLAPPTVSSFSINSDGAVKWATITGAIGYDYQIAYDAGDYSSIEHTGTASLNPISNFNSYKTIKIKVRASGNQANVVSSAWVEYVWNNPNK